MIGFIIAVEDIEITQQDVVDLVPIVFVLKEFIFPDNPVLEKLRYISNLLDPVRGIGSITIQDMYGTQVEFEPPRCKRYQVWSSRKLCYRLITGFFLYLQDSF